MEVHVYDESRNCILVGSTLEEELIEQPLVTEKRNIYSFPFGDAELVQLAFSGIVIIYGDLQIRHAAKLYFEMLGQNNLVEMHFTLAGNGLTRNEATGQEYRFKENHHTMHYTPVFAGTGDYRDHERYKFFEVHFTKRFFSELAQDCGPLLTDFAEKIETNYNEGLSRDSLPISFAMHQCIRDIMNSRFTGRLKLLFLQSKCIELLALQAQMYEDAAGKSSTLICKSDYDRDRIYYAREYLVQNALEPPSLAELAKISGINEFKLKQGFKEIFNTTVFGYLSDYKLGQARDLLQDGNRSIKEIADGLGYSSVQHFNNAFRKKFGTPPGKVRP